MTSVTGFTDRDGLDKIIKLGKALCRLLVAFTPVLLAKYPDNQVVKDLIAAINGVCLVLPSAEATLIDFSGSNDIPLETPENIPGIDANKEQAYPPDYTEP